VKVRKIDYVGIAVNDRAAAKAFFLEFGLELQGEGIAEGEWMDNVVGLHDVKDAYTMFRTPDGEANIELIQFYRPTGEQDIQRPLSNTPDIRHIAFVVARLTKNGTEIFSEIQTYEDIYKLSYIRGPEGIILELAEQSK
jgi:catechol 2,3-dioxygenase-like lactoylglutathione lyase family enzyme